MMILKYLAIVATILVCRSAAADVDCTQRPAMVDPKQCCNIPEIVTEEIREQCAEYDNSLTSSTPSGSANELDSDDRPRPHPHPHPHPHPRPHPHPHPRPHPNPCFFSCVANKTGIIDADNNLDESMLSDYLNNVFEDTPDFIPVMEEAFKTCAKKAEDFKARIAARMQNYPSPPSPPPAHGRFSNCHPGGSMLIGCAFMETFQNCPVSVWTDTEECNNWRDFMTSCKGKKHGRF